MKFLLAAILSLMVGCGSSGMTASTSGGHYLFTYQEIGKDNRIYEISAWYHDDRYYVFDVQANKDPVERFVVRREAGHCWIALPGEVDAVRLDDCTKAFYVAEVLERGTGISLVPDSTISFLQAVHEWSARRSAGEAAESGPLERVK